MPACGCLRTRATVQHASWQEHAPDFIIRPTEQRTCHAKFERCGTTVARKTKHKRPPHHVVAQRCAAPCRLSSGLSATTPSLSKPSATVTFLLGGAKSSSADRTIIGKILVNTWDLRQMMLWCADLASCAWLCVGV